MKENPIGLIMQRDYFINDKYTCILNQFMIDENYQGQGYGKKALRLWIAKISSENKYCQVRLCYIEWDKFAERLYKDIGFNRKPEDDGDELVMIYEFKD